jgi:hypothetical protein
MGGPLLLQFPLSNLFCDLPILTLSVMFVLGTAVFLLSYPSFFNGTKGIMGGPLLLQFPLSNLLGKELTLKGANFTYLKLFKRAGRRANVKCSKRRRACINAKYVSYVEFHGYKLHLLFDQDMLIVPNELLLAHCVLHAKLTSLATHFSA